MKQYLWAVLLMTCALFSGCSADDDEESTGDVSMTGETFDVGLTCATVRGFAYINRITVEITDYQYGIQYEPASNGGAFVDAPKIEGTGMVSNYYTCTITGLLPNTEYVARSYVTANGLVFYGEKKTFTTGETLNIAQPISTQDIKTSAATITAKVDTTLMSKYSADKEYYQAGIAYSTNQFALVPDEDGELKDAGIYTFFSGTNMPYPSNTFVATLSGLEAGALYYYCTYTSCNGKYTCGSLNSFNTKSGMGEMNGYAYADLGLTSGTLWATMNLGASKAEDYGNYYAWGETSPKQTYTWENYKFTESAADSTVTKYNASDRKTTLDLADDAAYTALGKDWAMPSYDQITELLTECTWKWTTQNGVSGCKVTGPNHNSIFMPAAGYMDGTQLIKAGNFGFYWANCMETATSALSFYIDFNSIYSGRDLDSRHFGQTIRPVVRQAE